MKPRRTHESNQVLQLPGGTEDNDLWVRMAEEDELPVIESVWEPSDAERLAIGGGQNVKLTAFATSHPPVMLTITDVELGKPPETPSPGGLTDPNGGGQ